MIFDDDTVSWLTYAVLAFDAALVMWGDSQPVLFPRTLCRGQRLVLDTPRRRKRKRSGKR